MRAMPPKPNRRPREVAAFATWSTWPSIKGSNIKLQPSERCKSLSPTKTSWILGVSIQLSIVCNAPAVSSNGTKGTLPATAFAKPCSSSALLNMGSISMSAPSPNTASISALLASGSCVWKGLTRTNSFDRLSTARMRPTSFSSWVLINVLRPFWRAAFPLRSRSTNSLMPGIVSQLAASSGWLVMVSRSIISKMILLFTCWWRQFDGSILNVTTHATQGLPLPRWL